MKNEKRKAEEKSPDKETSKSRFSIRQLKREDMESAAKLIVRLKKLNGEFDPLLKTAETADTASLRILRESVGDKEQIVLVALSGSRVVGIAKAAVRDRVFYEPRKEGAIVELYVMPEFRRGSLGRELFEKMVSSLRSNGAELITAEFPSQNEIARKFYTKLGFRSLTNVYAKLY
jgi:ribosomal protein S18 acetylase RimI-like enzyme